LLQQVKLCLIWGKDGQKRKRNGEKGGRLWKSAEWRRRRWETYEWRRKKKQEAFTECRIEEKERRMEQGVRVHP
jgi:hypothetical protein